MPLSASIVCVTYERPEGLRRLLASAAGQRAIDIVVVNNSSTPIELVGAATPTRVVELAAGLNVSRARNVGWRSSEGDVVVFVDDDNVMTPGMIRALLDVLEDDRIGLAAPIMLGISAETELLCAGVTRSMWTTRTQGVMPTGYTWPIESMPSSYAIKRTALEEVGGFDEADFPFHYEETDLARRIAQAGWGAVGVAGAQVLHETARRSPVAELSRAASLSSMQRVSLQIRARFVFHRRYATGRLQYWIGGLAAPICYSALLAFAVVVSREITLERKKVLVRAIASGVSVGVLRGPRYMSHQRVQAGSV